MSVAAKLLRKTPVGRKIKYEKFTNEDSENNKKKTAAAVGPTYEHTTFSGHCERPRNRDDWSVEYGFLETGLYLYEDMLWMLK